MHCDASVISDAILRRVKLALSPHLALRTPNNFNTWRLITGTREQYIKGFTAALPNIAKKVIAHNVRLA